jgi:uncharacterized membrane protein
LWLEHAGIVSLLVSGFTLLAMLGFDQAHTTWLGAKLLLVLGIIVPIEVADIWFSHIGLPGVFRHRQPTAAYTGRDRALLELYHRRFTPIALPILLLAVAAITWLAVAKPA